MNTPSSSSVAKTNIPRDASVTLVEVVKQLSRARELDTITKIVRSAARELTGADGATFVLKTGDECYYADEDAISPLWKGQRFPLNVCIGGWVILNRKPAVIRDIYEDNRIPHDAYRPTFVKSLCSVPIRREDPLGTISVYWATHHKATSEEKTLIQTLADTTAVALENVELSQTLAERLEEKDTLVSRHRELEACLYSMVHDMKTPLSTIVGFSDLLDMKINENGTSQPEESDHLAVIRRNANTLLSRVDEMVSLYRVSSSKPEKKTVNLSSVAESIVENLRSQDRERVVTVDIDPALTAQGAPKLLDIVLENLLTNAWKFSRKNSHAHIRFGKTVHEKGPAFYVKDDGVGFDSDKAQQLFQPLMRLHEDGDFEGTGLGLASVARIIESHGGTVWAEGEAGKGATFYFQL